MPARQSALESSSAIDGEPGHSNPAGRTMGEISLGPKQLGWSSLYNPSSRESDPELTSRYLETTEVLSKGGGPGAVGTSKSTRYSNESIPSSAFTTAWFTPDMSPAHPTLQTAPQEASFLLIARSSLLLNPLMNSNHSSSLTITPHMESIGSSMILETFQMILAAEPTLCPQENAPGPSPTWIPEPGKNLSIGITGKALKIQSNVRTLPSPGSLSSLPPHPPSLALNTSALCPHCHAGDRIHLWKPRAGQSSNNAQGNPTPLDQIDMDLIEGVSLNSLQPSTRASYGAGLLAFHLFCDSKKVDKNLRAPVNPIILESFIARMAGIYCASTISGYVAAIQAWHIVHSLPWSVDGPGLNAIVKGAQRMASRDSERQKREPVTIEFTKKVSQQLSETNSLDVTVLACLTMTFLAVVRLGEMTVPSLSAFDPKRHIKRSDLGESVDRQGLRTTSIHIPITKGNQNEGENLYWAKQDDPSNPESTLKKHLEINSPPVNFHLFRYPNAKGIMLPLSKKTFITQVSKAATIAGLPQIKGHSIRIGATLEYLLRGLPFDVMKVKGRWNSNACHKYLCNHAKVMAPYMQTAPPNVHDQFIHVAVPLAH